MKTTGTKNMKEQAQKRLKKKVIGTVLKKSGDKYVVVVVERKFKHPVYRKFILRSKKYHAHDESNTCKQGDVVSIVESRPLSKLKRWVVVGN